MRPTWSLAACALAASACDRGDDFTLDFGDATEACGLAIVHDDAEIFSAVVLDLADGELTPPTFDLPVRDDRILTWLVAPERASKLGLTPGPLNFTRSGRRLPQFSQIHSRTRAGGWERLEQLPAILEQARSDEIDLVAPTCGRLEITQFVLPSSASQSRVVGIDGDVLVVTSRDEVFVINSDLMLRAIPDVVASTSQPLYLSVAQRSDGSAWAGRGACMERIHALDTQLAFDYQRRFCVDEPYRAYEAVSLDASEFLIVARREVSESVFQSSKWRAGDRTAARAIIGQHPPLRDTIAATAQGTYWGVLPGTKTALRLDPRATAFVEESVPVTAEYLNVLGYVPGVGLLAGDSGGLVLRRGEEEARWYTVGDPGFFYGVTGFAPYRGGFVVAGGTTEGARYLPNIGFCELGSVSAGVTTSIAPLRDGLVFGSDRHPHSNRLAVTFARWVE